MNIAIILSGGVGTRMGADIPKQYIMVEGKPIIMYCVNTFAKNKLIDIIIIGVADEWRSFVRDNVESSGIAKPVYYARPGETRQLSIYNALKQAKEIGAKRDDIVIIHDAARPLVSDDIIATCLDGCSSADGVLPIIQVKDTIYISSDGKTISGLLRREELFAGQAPEAFRFGKYMDIHESLSDDIIRGINGSTEIAYKYGMTVNMIKGSEMNFKITTPEDLSNFKTIITNKQ